MRVIQVICQPEPVEMFLWCCGSSCVQVKAILKVMQTGSSENTQTGLWKLFLCLVFSGEEVCVWWGGGHQSQWPITTSAASAVGCCTKLAQSRSVQHNCDNERKRRRASPHSPHESTAAQMMGVHLKSRTPDMVQEIPAAAPNNPSRPSSFDL